MSTDQKKVAAEVLQYRLRADILAQDGHYDLAYELRRIADELVFRYREFFSNQNEAGIMPR